MDPEEQYDRIFRYLYFHLHDEHTAEDLTQETFLRFLKSRTYREENRQLQYLYTIARNLYRQHYREQIFTCPLEETEDTSAAEGFEQPLLEQIVLREALRKLPPEEKELLFLRYVNEVPIAVLGGMFKISRFAVYRKLRNALKRIRGELEGRQNE